MGGERHSVRFWLAWVLGAAALIGVVFTTARDPTLTDPVFAAVDQAYSPVDEFARTQFGDPYLRIASKLFSFARSPWPAGGAVVHSVGRIARSLGDAR